MLAIGYPHLGSSDEITAVSAVKWYRSQSFSNISCLLNAAIVQQGIHLALDYAISICICLPMPDEVNPSKNGHDL
jgi:hypothetical protein